MLGLTGNAFSRRDADPLTRLRLVPANSRFTYFIPYITRSPAEEIIVVIARAAGSSDLGAGSLGFKIVAGGTMSNAVAAAASFICLIGWLHENIAAARTYGRANSPRVPSPFFISICFFDRTGAKRPGARR